MVTILISALVSLIVSFYYQKMMTERTSAYFENFFMEQEKQYRKLLDDLKKSKTN